MINHTIKADNNLKRRLIFLLLFLFAAPAFLFAGAGSATAYDGDRRLEYDPAWLKLTKIENVNGEPFSASINNLSTGKEFEYFTGDFIGALEVYKIDSMQVELRHRLSRQRYMLALPLNTIKSYAERNYKDEAELDYDQALLYYKADDASSAVELLKKAVKKRSGFEEALFLLAYIFHEKNYYAEAYDYYTQVMVVNPRNYKCLYNMAEILAINSKINDAVFTLKKCLKLRPDYDKALGLLSKINDEIEAKKKKKSDSKQDAAIRAREVETLKKTISQYADNIKQLEAALEESKNNKTDSALIEAELSRYNLLYNNTSNALEEKLKK
jgi:tetratricopeptide (TPR) repeat protein